MYCVSSVPYIMAEAEEHALHSVNHAAALRSSYHGVIEPVMS
jgi:hypothetical protein